MRWLIRLFSRLLNMEALLLVILKEVIAPRLADFIQKKFTETGQLPTTEELTEELSKDVTGTIERGNAFLNRP